MTAARINFQDIDEVKRTQERAKHVACRRGYPELADDFSQELFANWLAGRGGHQTIDQAFIDYLRALYGRTGPRGSGSGSGSGGKPKPWDFVDIDECRGLAEPTRDLEPSWGFAHLFGGRDAFLYQARFVEELSESAIAGILGVTESRICQLLKPIARTIQDAALLASARERMEWDEDFGKVAVEWITL